MIPDNIIKELNQAFLEFTNYSDTLLKNIGDRTSNIKPEISGIITERIPKILSDVFDTNKYEITGSIGKGRQTKCPWVAVMDKEITDTTQKGVYIVFLMTANLREVYITIGQGTTVEGIFGRRLKGNDILTRKEQIRSMLNLKNKYLQENDDVDVADKHYKKSLIYSCPWDLSTTENKSEILEEYERAYQKYKKLSSNNGTPDPSDNDDPYQKLIDEFKEIHARKPFNGYKELYKWNLITLCHEKSNIEIAGIISKNHRNLLYTSDASSLNRTILATEDSKSKFSEILDQLFDESKDIKGRLEQYKKSVKDSWPQETNLPDDNRSASVFLTCKYPQKYTFCIKQRVFEPLCKYLEETEDPGSNFYPKFMELILPLVEKISADQELKDMIEESTKGYLQSDPLTAQTIIYTLLHQKNDQDDENEEEPSQVNDTPDNVHNGQDNNNMINPITANNIIFYGAPGTGKSNKIELVIKKLGRDKFIRTTFHPDSDYSTFVGCFKPVKDKDTGNITYGFMPQAFIRAYVKAWQKLPSEPVYLIIEEINRGNCAQIFGDIFQLLDRQKDGTSSYEIFPDADLQEYLSTTFIEDGIRNDAPEEIKNGSSMKLPNNLYIWATMNTSDQSLFPIDSAFKRRWNWEYSPISRGIDKDTHLPLSWKVVLNGNKYDWWEFLKAINNCIEKSTQSEDKKLGYFFAVPSEEEIISAKTFLGKVIFYIWNDVFKDLGPGVKPFTYNNTYHRFHEFFLDDGNPNEKELEAFMNGLELKAENNTEPTEE